MYDNATTMPNFTTKKSSLFEAFSLNKPIFLEQFKES